jgi:hypothetical protein
MIPEVGKFGHHQSLDQATCYFKICREDDTEYYFNYVHITKGNGPLNIDLSSVPGLCRLDKYDPFWSRECTEIDEMVLLLMIS